jgi:signal transduction histidine kinase
MYEPIAEDKGIALLIHSPHELSVHGDRDLLIEAIANLVDNAVKFTPEIDRILRETITDRLVRNSWPRRHSASQRDATQVALMKFRAENRRTIAAQ